MVVTLADAPPENAPNPQRPFDERRAERIGVTPSRELRRGESRRRERGPARGGSQQRTASSAALGEVLPLSGAGDASRLSTAPRTPPPSARARPLLALASSALLLLVACNGGAGTGGGAEDRPLRLTLWEQEPEARAVASRALLAVVSGAANEGADALQLELLTRDGALCAARGTPEPPDTGVPAQDGGVRCEARIVYPLSASEEGEQSFVTIFVTRDSVPRPLVVGIVTNVQSGEVLASVPRRLGAATPLDAGAQRAEEDAGAATDGGADDSDAGADSPDAGSGMADAGTPDGGADGG